MYELSHFISEMPHLLYKTNSMYPFRHVSTDASSEPLHHDTQLRDMYSHARNRGLLAATPV